MRELVESTQVYNKYYNQAFVVMQYFGYLRRQPDALYVNWIAHLDATGDSRSMITGSSTRSNTALALPRKQTYESSRRSRRI